MRIEAEAFAKLNLALRIRGRRGDGFHEVESLVQTVSLADRIVVDVRSGDEIVVHNSAGPFHVPDLAGRAAAIVLAAKGVSRRVEIRIEKGIPPGSGLGGGSSDAAAMLRVLDRSVGTELGETRLHELAATLGSDVPLFLLGGRVLVTGRGELAESQPPGGEVFVLLIPRLACPTAEVYAVYDDLGQPRPAEPLVLGENDLAAAALRVRPELARVDQAIRSAGGEYAGMSGSGAAFYVACRSREEAEAVRLRLLAADVGKAMVTVPTQEGVRWREVDET